MAEWRRRSISSLMAVSFSMKVSVWGDIGLWLVVVVVGDKVFHRIVGKELLELRAQLRGQGFVVGQHKGGTLDLLNDLGHGKGFAGAGHPQKGLFVQSQLHALGQAGDGLGLIPGGGCVADDLKFLGIETLPVQLFSDGGLKGI